MSESRGPYSNIMSFPLEIPLLAISKSQLGWQIKTPMN